MSWEHYLVHSSSLLVHFLPIIVHYGSSQDSASAIRQQLGANQSRAKHSFIQHLLNQAAQLRKHSYLQKWQPGKRHILATQGGQDKHRDSLDVCATNWRSIQSLSRDINPLIVPGKWYDGNLADKTRALKKTKNKIGFSIRERFWYTRSLLNRDLQGKQACTVAFVVWWLHANNCPPQTNHHNHCACKQIWKQ